MKYPQELDVVKIIRLNSPHRPVMGSENVLRQPEIGDVGTVVDIPETNSQEKIFTIECVAKGGYTAWLADFSEDEIEIVHRVVPSDKLALHQALIQAVDGEIEWVSRLLKAGTNPNGMPLLMAIQCDQSEIVQMLLDAGADFDQDFADTTPLVHAVTGTHLKIVSILMQAGANVNKKALNGYTPLAAAKTRVGIMLRNQKKKRLFIYSSLLVQMNNRLVCGPTPRKPDPAGAALPPT